jgi:hypothetical protein
MLMPWQQSQVSVVKSQKMAEGMVLRLSTLDGAMKEILWISPLHISL